MSPARFDLFGEDDCPVAQGVALALVHRRTFFRWAPAGGATVLRITDPDGEGVQLIEPRAMLEWIEDLLPDRTMTLPDAETDARARDLMRQASRLPVRIAAVTSARHARDLDLAQHFLHEALLPFEAAATGGARTALTSLDFLLAPVLWRIDLLDRRFGAHLLGALPRLRARIGWFLGLPHSERVLNAAAEKRFLAAVAATGGVLATGGHRCDWSRAFGPAAETASRTLIPAETAARPLWRRRISASWRPAHE